MKKRNYFVLLAILAICIKYFAKKNILSLEEPQNYFQANVSTIENKISAKYKSIFIQVFNNLKNENPFHDTAIALYSFEVDSNNEVIGVSFDIVVYPKIDDLKLLMQIKTLKYIEINLRDIKIEELEQFYKYKDEIFIYYYIDASNELQGKLIEKPFVDGVKARSKNRGFLPRI